ncbi:hypothetical protein HY256_10190, partial [Candidatus Sumerlaeota bacterium]|nr:hypothetical protein [Candidatus Sumerlaeota bacterium]
VERPIEDFSPALAPLGKIELRPPVLWLDYERRDEYKPGQWIVINFELENPEGAAFDELRFALRYDPDTLEFQDTDQRNWIRTGINLLDGPFRETWDWDTHIKNEIQPKSGLIDYRMGRKALRHFPSGTVARGIARVKKPAHEPLFEWVLNPGEEKLKPTTGVYLLGENLIERYAKEFTIEAESAAAHAPGLPEKADPAIYR